MRLKTDSFVVESNVHFPTDYNLLWDSIRKTSDCINKLSKHRDLAGWRKLKSWKGDLKNLMRAVSLSAKKSEENRKTVAQDYLNKAKLFLEKIKNYEFPLETEKDLLF